MAEEESLKKEIKNLSTKLKDLGSEKEKAYRQKEELDKQLSKEIKDAKGLKEEKRQIDSQIKDLKAKREVLNKELGEMFAKLKELKLKHGIEPVKKEQTDRRVSPAAIKRQIDAIQYTIQTEVLSFEKEKRYMETIKKLKLQYNEVANSEEKVKEIFEYKKLIRAKKEEADKLHKQVQELANKSTQIFNQLTDHSKTISEAKEKKKGLQTGLKSTKSEIDNVNQNLGTALKSWSKTTATKVRDSAKKSLANIQKQTKDVVAKFKTKKKLTKEDILLLQRGAMAGGGSEREPEPEEKKE